MAVAKKSVDKYSNIMNQTIQMSATDTLTFEEVQLGLNLFDKVGILVNRVEIDLDNTSLRGLVAATDSISFALTTSAQLTSIDLSQQAVIDKREWVTIAAGTPANAIIDVNPLVMDFTGLPEKGKLIAPKPLYLALNSAGMGAACTANVRFYFTVVPLKAEEYFELLESRQFFG